MIIEGALGEQDDIINIDNDILKGTKDVHHFGLEDVTRWHETLQEAGIGVAVPWEYDTTEFPAGFIENKVIIASVQIKASGKLEPIHLPNNFFNQR
jgi:hypothetical protein